MALFHSPGEPFVPPRDDMTVPRFMFNLTNPHLTRPIRPIETPCMVDEISGRKVFYPELEARTYALARALKVRWEIQEDDVVAMYCPNDLDYPVCIWAVHLLGGIASPLSPTLTVEELTHQLQIAKPRLLITNSSSLEVSKQAADLAQIGLEHFILLDDNNKIPPSIPYYKLEELVEEGLSQTSLLVEKTFSPGEARKRIAFLSFSSGTTGKPKAVSISHYNVISNVVQVATWHRINDDRVPQNQRRFRAGGVCSGVLPLYHIYGLVVNLHFIIYAGMSLVVSPKFHFETMLESIVKYKITHLLIVPPQVVLFCKHPAVKKYNLSHVHYCMMAAAPVSAELTAQFLAVMPQMHLGQGYGMTETCATIAMYPLVQRVGTPGSAGQLISGTIGKVVKLDGSLAQPGELGELLIKGDQVAMGYYHNDEATRETFVEGWVRTGDEVIIKPDSDLFVIDRIKEILKVKGLQVAPAELEGHLLDHPDVADAGVIGIPDDYAGEVPMAFVALQPKTALQVKQNPSTMSTIKADIQFDQHVSAVKSPHKWLAGGVEFIEAIPKSPSGKILRRLLREKALSLHPREKARL